MRLHHTGRCPTYTINYLPKPAITVSGMDFAFHSLGQSIKLRLQTVTSESEFSFFASQTLYLPPIVTPTRLLQLLKKVSNATVDKKCRLT
jgi:hypothetical protein